MEFHAFTKVRDEFQEHAKTLTDAWQETGKPVNARFPRGYIRSYADLRPRWPYLDDAHKTLVCQVLQLCDVNRWNLFIWDLSGPAGAASVWHATLPVVAVMEVLCRELIKKKGLKPKGKNFFSYIELLKANNIVSEALADEMHRLRQYRNIVHLNADETPEIEGNGLPVNWNHACQALQELEDCLTKNF